MSPEPFDASMDYSDELAEPFLVLFDLYKSSHAHG